MSTFIDFARATTAQRGWCPTPRAVAAVLLDAAEIVADRLSAGVYAVITPSPFLDDDVCDLIAEAIAPRETRSFQEHAATGDIVFLTDATPAKFASTAIVKATAVGASAVYVADDFKSFPSAYPASAVTRFDIANLADDALVAAVLRLTHEADTDGVYGGMLVPDDLLNLINPRAPISDTLAKLRRLADDRRADNSPPAVANAAVPLAEAAKAVVTRLRDLSGYGEAKTWGLRLAEDLHAYKVGEIEWQDVDCGVLLSGPPGCGKTFFANALAAECEVPLIATSYSDWHAATVGDTVSRSLATLFKAWRKRAQDGPIIVFVDEIDSIGARGDSSHNDGWYRTIINAWLAFLDGAEPRTGIVVIAATNLPDKVDPALCRPGRLDRHVKLPTPTIEDLEGVLKFHLGAGAQEDDLPGAAVACRGRMPAQIAQAARDARRVARRARRKVKASDVARLVRAQRRKFPADLDWSTAIHEAAHALIAVVLGIDLVYVDLDKSQHDNSAAGYGCDARHRQRPRHRRPGRSRGRGARPRRSAGRRDRRSGGCDQDADGRRRPVRSRRAHHLAAVRQGARRSIRAPPCHRYPCRL